MGAFPEKTIPAPGLTFWIPNEMDLTAHGNLTAGDIVALDWATGSDGFGATTTKALDNTTGNINDDEYNVVGVVKHTVASGKSVTIVFRSSSVLATFSAVAVARGGACKANVGAANLAAVTVNTRVVAIALEAANGNTKRVFFNGVEGLGFKGTA